MWLCCYICVSMWSLYITCNASSPNNLDKLKSKYSNLSTDWYQKEAHISGKIFVSVLKKQKTKTKTRLNKFEYSSGWSYINANCRLDLYWRYMSAHHASWVNCLYRVRHNKELRTKNGYLRWKIYPKTWLLLYIMYIYAYIFLLIVILIIQPNHKLAYATTARLSWHLRNCGLIPFSYFVLQI